MSAADLWAGLHADGLVEGERPDEADPPSPWYVRAMLGIAGWIGALFLFMFFGFAFTALMQQAAFGLILGAACSAAAWALFRSFEGQDFVEQFALATGLAGQALLILGLSELVGPHAGPLFFAVALTLAVLALAIPNFLYRVLAAAGAAIALALATTQMAASGIAVPMLVAGFAWVWAEPERWAGKGRLWRPAGYGVALALLILETSRLLDAESFFAPGNAAADALSAYWPLVGRAATAAILVGAVVVLCLRQGRALESRTTLAAAGAALLLGFISLKATGLASALLILLLGFAAASRVLMTLGIAALLGFIGHFYYSLQWTLLDKAGTLAIAGICLLAAWFVLRSGGKPPAPSGGAADA